MAKRRNRGELLCYGTVPDHIGLFPKAKQTAFHCPRTVPDYLELIPKQSAIQTKILNLIWFQSTFGGKFPFLLPPLCDPCPAWPQDGKRTQKAKDADRAEAKRLKIGKGPRPKYSDTVPLDVKQKLNSRQTKFLNIAHASLLVARLNLAQSPNLSKPAK